MVPALPPERGRVRIIPARGEHVSINGVGRLAVRLDHPRARGTCGSRVTCLVQTGRIIPARGNLAFKAKGTLRSRRVIPARGEHGYLRDCVHIRGSDHPRARGTWGIPLVSKRCGQRFIPARGKHSLGPSLSVSSTLDNPCAWGTLRPAHLRQLEMSASSPRARNADRATGLIVAIPRIIPACREATAGGASQVPF